MTRRPIALTGALFAPLLFAACSESTAPAAGRTVSVSFASLAPAASASLTRGAGVASLRSVTATSGTDVLVIDRIQLVLARMELVRTGATCAASVPAGDDQVDEHDCAELELAPSIVDLPLDGTVANVLSVTVPAGSYSALEAKIRALRADGDRGHGSQDFLASHPDFAGSSVVVTGTFNGQAFTWRGAPRAELETTWAPPLVVDASPVNLTVHADVTTWFKTQSGTLIDPRTANAGGTNAGVVTENVRRSFSAFRDDDRNGHDDGDDHARS